MILWDMHDQQNVVSKNRNSGNATAGCLFAFALLLLLGVAFILIAAGSALQPVMEALR